MRGEGLTVKKGKRYSTVFYWPERLLPLLCGEGGRLRGVPFIKF